VSHVVVDEVHERSLQGDVLMALLQRIAAARNKKADEAAAAGRGTQQQQQQQHGQPQRLKVILMSATLDAHIYRWSAILVAWPSMGLPACLQ
jgi:HrpA-like RNA helicase